MASSIPTFLASLNRHCDRNDHFAIASMDNAFGNQVFPDHICKSIRLRRIRMAAGCEQTLR